MSLARTLSLGQMSIYVSLFNLHGPSVVSPVLLYDTKSAFMDQSNLTQTSTRRHSTQGTRRGHPCPMDREQVLLNLILLK